MLFAATSRCAVDLDQIHVVVNVACFDLTNCANVTKMKVKVISRNPDEYLRETKRDIHKGKLLFHIK